MPVSISINPHQSLFIRDPKSTDLGKRIISNSIELMAELGFEQFTFRKLAEHMGSSEVSMYRYFENKHKLLLYLDCWYWEWTRFLVEWKTENIEDPKERLTVAVKMVTSSAETNAMVGYVDEQKLYKIVIEEASKAYHTKAVDEENKEGLYRSLKALNETLADIIRACNPDFEHPKSLAIYVLEMSKNYFFYAEHLPSLTEVSASSDHPSDEVFEILIQSLYRQLSI